MKSTGIVIKIDNLGRIVLPAKLRKANNISAMDSLEIFVDDNKIVLQKYEPADIFTGETDDLIEFEGRTVSKKSILIMAKMAGLKIKEITER